MKKAGAAQYLPATREFATRIRALRGRSLGLVALALLAIVRPNEVRSTHGKSKRQAGPKPMNKSKRSGSYAASSVIASVVLFYAIRLSASGRTAIDWVVMGLVICALLYSLAQLTRRLYRAGGTKDAWHVQRTVLFWIVGLLNTVLLRPEHVDSWRPWVGWLFLVAAAVNTVTLFIKERAIAAGSEMECAADQDLSA